MQLLVSDHWELGTSTWMFIWTLLKVSFEQVTQIISWVYQTQPSSESFYVSTPLLMCIHTYPPETMYSVSSVGLMPKQGRMQQYPHSRTSDFCYITQDYGNTTCIGDLEVELLQHILLPPYKIACLLYSSDVTFIVKCDDGWKRLELFIVLIM